MIEAIISGLTLVVFLAISVGPVIFAIIKQSITNGRKGGYAFVAGVSSSDVAIVLVCNLLNTVFQKAIDNKVTIGVAGSIFLIAVGIYTLFFKKATVANEVSNVPKQFRKRELLGIYISGFLMNTLNPAVFIFWLAATAKIHAQAETQMYPLAFIYTVFIVCLLFVLTTDVAKVLLAGKIRDKLTTRNILIINKISGLILIGFGAVLIWSLVFHKPLGH